MFLKRFLKEEYIDPDLGSRVEVPDEIGPKSQDEVREQVIRRLVELLERSDQVSNPSKLTTDLLNREKRAPTGLGEGIALPHVRTMQARSLAVAVGVAREGIPWEAPDEEPVQVFIALVAPPYDDKLYMKAYQNVGEVLDREGIREALLDAEKGEIVRLMTEDVWLGHYR